MSSLPLQTQGSPAIKRRMPWAPGQNLNTLADQKAHLMNGIQTRRDQGVASPNDRRKLAQVNQGIQTGMSNARTQLSSQLAADRASRANPQAPANVSAVKKPTPWSVPTDAGVLQSQRDHIAAGIADRKAKGIASPQDDVRLAKIDQAIAGQQPTPTTTTTDAGATTDTSGTTDTRGATTDTSGGDPSGSGVNGSSDASSVLFPSQRAFEPENYQGSPLYDWQKTQGEKSINKTLAKRGLLNSGAEVQALGDFNTALAAGESDKARGYAQNEADRYERIQNNEAGRRERQGTNASNDLFRWTQMMLGENPANASFGGTDKYAGAVGNTYDSLSKYLSDQYKRVHAVKSRGGYTPGYFPSGPDFSNINTVDSVTGGQNSNSIFDTLIKNLPSIFA